MTALLAAACAVLLAVCALGALYFLVVVPGRWRIPLHQALVILEKNPYERTDLEEADRLIDQALAAGPRGKDLAAARFCQAFVHAMLGTYTPDRYWTASATAESLVTAEDPATAHLALWLQHKLERHERAVEIYDQHAESLAERDTARRAAAASHLHLAGANWRRRDTDIAMHHFDQVRELGALTAEIPKAADNLHVFKGIQAFFDHRPEAARSAFKTARERAVEHEQSTVEADLGLIACDWLDSGAAELDGRLREIEIGPPDTEHQKQLRSSVALLRLVVLLRLWLEREPLSGAPGERDRLEFRERARALREADPELGDSYLVQGLVEYYFALNEDERETALTTLEDGSTTAKGIVVPEVLQLVEKERALGGQGDALSRFLRLVHEFLADPTISGHHRTELRTLRDQFARYSDGLGEELQLPTRPASPYELEQRIDAVRRRINLIVYPRLRDQPEDGRSRVILRERLAELDVVAESFAAQAQALHQSEHSLVMWTGEILLPQEEVDDHAAAGDLDDGVVESA